MATATPSLTRPVEVPRDRFEQEVLQHKGQVLVELWRPGKDTEFFTRALAEQAQRHPEVKLVRINVDEYGDLIQEYHRRRAINQTYDLAHVPGVALFRNGKLITTMKPLIVNSDPELIAYNVRRQLDVFLAKFVEDVKTSVPSDESDAPGGAAEGAAGDKDAKIKAALEKAARLKAERAKQKAAAGEGGGAGEAGAAQAAGAGGGEAGAAAAARPRAAAAGDRDARVQAALEKAARLKAERAKQQAAAQDAQDGGAAAAGEKPAAAGAAEAGTAGPAGDAGSDKSS
ncbi:thioredoxin family protein [Thermaerobacter sp. PB12/4term]|uniref:thioredoxin family protein n=1 Tax=Thermaerobacter sp. PB12/4term TaxID=2293838 RepID=UPI000E3252C6|nr:thioredoxin family protein [Thermaerobacter sp. PB12/4term]QIA27301.1 thioredoxin family protein [Thermaerobacter sp. PB12/4term]